MITLSKNCALDTNFDLYECYCKQREIFKDEAAYIENREILIHLMLKDVEAEIRKNLMYYDYAKRDGFFSFPLTSRQQRVDDRHRVVKSAKEPEPIIVKGQPDTDILAEFVDAIRKSGFKGIKREEG